MKKIALCVFLLSCVWANSGLTTEISAKILKVGRSKTRIIIVSPEAAELERGSVYTVARNCKAKVIKVKGRKALLSTKACKKKSVLRRGKRIFIAGMVDDFDSGGDDGGSSSGSSSGFIAKGIRFGLARGFFSGDVEVEAGAGSSGSGDVGHIFSLFGGYAFVPLKKIGFIATLAYMSYDYELSSIRADANATYGFHKKFYAFAGLNLHKLSSSSSANEYSIGFGGQGGVCFQFHKNWGVDLAYAVINNSFENAYVEATYNYSGPEFSFHYTLNF